MISHKEHCFCLSPLNEISGIPLGDENNSVNMPSLYARISRKEIGRKTDSSTEERMPYRHHPRKNKKDLKAKGRAKRVDRASHQTDVAERWWWSYFKHRIPGIPAGTHNYPKYLLFIQQMRSVAYGRFQVCELRLFALWLDRKSTRLNSSHPV